MNDISRIVDGTVSKSELESRAQVMAEMEERDDDVTYAQETYNEVKWLAFLGLKTAGVGAAVMASGFALGMIRGSLFYIWVPGLLIFLASFALVVAVVTNNDPVELKQRVLDEKRQYARAQRRLGRADR